MSIINRSGGGSRLDSIEAEVSGVSTQVTGIATQVTNVASQVAATDVASVRSNQSGSLSMTGSEQTLYEKSQETAFRFDGGWLDLSALADTRSVTIRVYVKVKSGGLYRKASEVVLTGAAAAGAYYLPQQLPIGTSVQKAVLPFVHNTYGIKVTIQQTVQGGGYISVDHEWYESV